MNLPALRDDAPHAQLIEKAAGGDREALDQLVEKYYRTVFSIGYARLRDWELAEELAQEVFLRATLHLESLRERNYFGPWLVRIARNVAEDWCRQDASRARVVTWIPLENLPIEPPDARQSSVREKREQIDDERLLQEAVLRLAPELREVVLLHFTEELTKSEIGRRLGLHPSSVARQLDRALLLLREDLGPRMGRAVQAIHVPAQAPARTTAALAALFTLSEATRQSAAAATASAAQLAATAGAGSGKAKSAAAAGGLVGKLLGLFSGGSAVLKGASAVTAAAVAALGIGTAGYYGVQKLRSAPFDEERFPLAADVSLLTAVPPLPAGRRAPVVYLAPAASPRPENRSAADAFQTLLRFALRGAPRSGAPLNVLSTGRMASVYRRDDGSGELTGHSRDEYLRDARSFDCDLFLATTVDEGRDTVSLELDFVDLRTSRSAASTTITTHQQFPRLLEEAVRTSARFCGLSDREVTEAQMTDGLPSASTWAFWRAGAERTGPQWRQALEDDPDCRALYASAADETGTLSIINDGLRRWPDDPRLLLSKVGVLRGLRKYETAALFCSELVRRYPDGLTFHDRLIENLVSLYPARPTPTDPPQVFRAGVEAIGNAARLFPSNFGARWNYAYACDRLAELAGGCRQCATSETTPTEVLAALAADYGRRAIEESDAALALRPDCPELLYAVIAFHANADHNDIRWQRPMLEELVRLDPSNVGGAISAAESHGIWGSDDEHFIGLLTEAAARHRDRPKSLSRIAHVIGSDLSERLKRGLISPDYLYRDRNPYSDLYVECTERALDGGIQVEKWMAGMLREIYRRRHGDGKVHELAESGKHWALTGGAAKAAHARQDFERSLRLARLSLRKSTEPDAREWMRYYIVRSLWKLKRHDESLAEARAGITEFPHKQTFHYLFAVVALEKGSPLEEAYDRATRAVEISTTNTGANETLEALREKLGKR